MPLHASVCLWVFQIDHAWCSHIHLYIRCLRIHYYTDNITEVLRSSNLSKKQKYSTKFNVRGLRAERLTTAVARQWPCMHASKPRQTPVNHAHYEGYIRLCPKSIFVAAHAHARAKYGTKSNRPLVFIVIILNRSRNYLFFTGFCLGWSH